GLDLRERREVVEVLVVQALGELAQVVLDLDEVEGEAVLVELVPGEGELHDVAVAVQTLALPLVVAEEVGAVVVGLNADDVHAAPSGAVQGDDADVHLGRPRDRVDNGVGDGAGVEHAVAGRQAGVPLAVDRVPEAGGGRRRLDQGRRHARAAQLRIEYGVQAAYPELGRGVGAVVGEGEPARDGAHGDDVSGPAG